MLWSWFNQNKPEWIYVAMPCLFFETIFSKVLGFNGELASWSIISLTNLAWQLTSMINNNQHTCLPQCHFCHESVKLPSQNLKYESCPFGTKFNWNIIFRKHSGLSDEVIVSLCKDKIEFRPVCLKKVSKLARNVTGCAVVLRFTQWHTGGWNRNLIKVFFFVVVVGKFSYLNS
jgi:hypothetical protein